MSNIIAGLRELLTQEASLSHWRTMLAFFDELDEGPEKTFALDYARSHLQEWPAELRVLNELDAEHACWTLVGGLRLDCLHSHEAVYLLPEHKHITFLELENLFHPQALNAISKISQLESLILRECEVMQKIEGYGALEHLHRLEFHGGVAQDLSWLGQLKQLKELSLVGEYPEDGYRSYKGPYLKSMKQLLGVRQLRALRLRRCDLLKDFRDLPAFRQLEVLEVSHCAQWRNLSLLARMPQLSEVNFSGCDRLITTQPMKALKQLKKLDLSDCVSLRHLNGLVELPALEWLDLRGCSGLPGELARCYQGEEVKDLQRELG